MKKWMTKAVSMLLIVILCCEMLPVNVLAQEEDSEEVVAEVLDDDPNATLLNDVEESGFCVYDYLTNTEQKEEVLYELEDLRDKAVKHFRMSDGSNIAVQYDAPVHYLDNNGCWQDIDNTLVLSSVADSDVYKAANGDHTVIFPAKLQDGTLFEVKNSEYYVKLIAGTTIIESDNRDRVETISPDAISPDSVNSISQMIKDQETPDASSFRKLNEEDFGALDNNLTNSTKESLVSGEDTTQSNLTEDDSMQLTGEEDEQNIDTSTDTIANDFVLDGDNGELSDTTDFSLPEGSEENLDSTEMRSNDDNFFDENDAEDDSEKNESFENEPADNSEDREDVESDDSENLSDLEDIESIETISDLSESSTDGTINDMSDLQSNPNSVAIRFASEQVNDNQPMFNAVQATVIEDRNAQKALMIDSESIEKSVQLPNISSAIMYSGAFDGATLQYNLKGYDIKESILVEERQDKYTYVFALYLENLIPTLEQDGSLLLKDGDAVVYEMPAPYMYDANDSFSNNVHYGLASINENYYIIVVMADSSWINNSERSFPVVIDPALVDRRNTPYISSTYLSEDFPNDSFYSSTTLSCGHSVAGAGGEMEIVVNINQLPAIPENCIINTAQFSLTHKDRYTLGSTTPVTIFASEITSELPTDTSVASWLQNMTYNTRPILSSEILDYQTTNISLNSGPIPYFWDITRAVRAWYEEWASDSYHPIALTADTESTELNVFYKTVSETEASYAPYLIVYYRNATGIEDYYSYQTEDVARAGKLYLNDCTSQFACIHSDVAISNAAFSFSLNHVYNSGNYNEAFSGENSIHNIHTCSFLSMNTGLGWKLSAQETVVDSQIGEYEYLIYNDSDGTEHYFSKDSNTSNDVFWDEDGLGLKITKETNGTNTIYTMSDTDSNFSKVFYNGYLNEYGDSNGNKIYYAYNSSYSTSGTSWKPTAGTSNQLKQIVEVTNYSAAAPITLATLSYSGDYLSSITDYAGRVTYFSYSNGMLTSIEHPDEKSAVYVYGNDNRMNTVYDEESCYGLSISYSSGNIPYVTQIREFSAPTVNSSYTYGNGYSIEKLSSEKTQYTFWGANHVIDNDSIHSDDVLEQYLFDGSGRTINHLTMDANKSIRSVSSTEYWLNDGHRNNINKVVSTASTGIMGPNLIKNASIENSLDWDVIGTDSTDLHEYYSSGYTVNGIPVAAHTGTKMLRIVNSSAEGRTIGYQNITLSAGRTYTLSAYINTQGINTSASEGTGAYVAFLTTSNSICASSTAIDYKTDTNIDNGWERISVSFTPNQSGTYRAAAYVDATGSTVAYDDLQLQVSEAPGRFNLIQDSSFENYETDWFSDGATENEWTLDSSDCVSGSYSICVEGDYAHEKTLCQTIPINKPAKGTTFILSGWSKAASAYFDADAIDAFWGMSMVLHLSNERTSMHTLWFSHSCSDWQYNSKAIIIPDSLIDSNTTIVSAEVFLSYGHNINTAWFDDISLIIEPVQTYNYDVLGNLTKIKEPTRTTNLSYYSGSQKLQSYENAIGATCSYTYDNNNNLLTTTCDGVTSTNSYTSNGGLTTTQTTATGTSLFLRSGNTYLSNRLYASYSEDVNGTGAGVSGCSGTLLLPTRILLPHSAVQRISYLAPTGRINMTYITNVIALSYTYQNGKVDGLNRKTFLGNSTIWQRYNMSYDGFGNVTSISVHRSADGTNWSAGRSLASYTYQSNVNNGLLSRLTYGNGSYIDYSYDLFDRKVATAYNDGTEYHFAYNGEGDMARQYETNPSGTIIDNYEFEYDTLGRLIRSREDKSDGSVLRTEHLYDSAGRVSSQSWQFSDGGAFSESYTYDADDGKLTAMESAADTSISLSYDALKRLTTETTTLDGASTSLFSKNYTYRDSVSTTNRTTLQVCKQEYIHGSNTLLGRSYTYQGPGNIMSVKDSKTNTTLATYTYDSNQNFLASETIYSNGTGTTYSYTYDTAGNIVSVSGGGTTHTYSYTNTDWADLLTAYDNHAISYDAIGNPLSYYNGASYTMTWAKGRRLNTLSLGSTSMSFAYDMDGIRRSKTVGTTTYKYDYLNDMVVRQTGNGYTLDFIYDANELPYALIYTTGSTSTTYYYLLSVQGDVIGLLNSFGSIVALYTYNAWGKLLSVTTANGAAITSSTNIALRNPLRYRGYYYDTETRFYYLQSRYYDPQIGRFLSCDTQIDTDLISALNLFEYCDNNPVNYSDTNGNLPFLAITAAIGAVAGAIIGGVKAAKSGNSVLKGAVKGAVVGGLVGLGVGAVASAALTGSLTASAKIVYTGAKAFSSFVASCGGAAGAKMLADNVSQSVSKSSQVFWSGGSLAKKASVEVANSVGGKTLEMTRVGQYLERTNAPMEQWKAASSCFARVASITNTQVYSVQSCTGVKITSVWATVEYPLLSLSNKTINYCVVMQDGIIKFL